MCMVMWGFCDDERLFESLSRIEWVVPQGPSEHGRYPVICFCVTFAIDAVCDKHCQRMHVMHGLSLMLTQGAKISFSLAMTAMVLVCWFV